MSLTDEKNTNFSTEKKMLSLAAEKVKNSCANVGLYPGKAENSDSFFAEKPDPDFLPSIIGEYDFITPVQFRKKMEEIWEKRGVHGSMKEFSAPVAVALFKNKPEKGGEQKKSDGKISEYIYEF